jgi:Antibiotic biosynthesis monooxygenase.
MINISKGEQILTLINIFNVAAEKQEELLKLLISCTDDFIANCPGFLSASYHQGIDGNSVVLYAQYENMEAFLSMINSKGGKRMVQEGTLLAESVQRSLCYVYDTREANV